MIGVLSLQGDFERHSARLTALGSKSTPITRSDQLKGIRGLIIPGGESSVLLKLCNEAFQKELADAIGGGLPVFATCAGLIFLAARVENPEQRSLAVIDVDVMRNAYGRQVDSFIDENLEWTASGRSFAENRLNGRTPKPLGCVEGVFIRAPRISRVGPNVETLIERQGEPVMVRQKNILAATFHPELSEKAELIHQLFLSLATK